MRRLIVLSLLFSLLFVPSTFGSNYHLDKRHKLTLISAYDYTGGLKSVTLGLYFQLVGDWKTYWRTPGQVGYKMRLNWSESTNVDSIKLHWPTPERFTTFNLESFGYSKEVVLPLTVVLQEPNKSSHVVIEIDYLICNPQLCIPKKVTLELDLNPFDSAGIVKVKQSDHFDYLATSVARIPRPDTGQGLTVDRVEIDLTSKKYELIKIIARDSRGFKQAELFIEGPEDVFFAVPEMIIGQNKNAAEFTIKVYADESLRVPPSKSLAGRYVTLTLKNQDQTIESIRPVIELKMDVLTILAMLVLAFIGGVILNVMPCVLPVLSIKLLSIMQQGGEKKGVIRRNFFLTVLGILSSFWVIAISAVAFKQAGIAIGWGIQFHQPVFLIAMILILTFFAYNLLGLFEIMLPAAMQTKLSRVGGRGSPWEHFFSGALVTILATPCTAPFMGTALSFALSRGAPEILSIFTAMGFGLALPFALIAVFPGLAQNFPRPGKWMVNVRKSLSVLLFVTVLWLLYTVRIQVGDITVIILSVIILTLGILLWIKLRRP